MALFIGVLGYYEASLYHRANQEHKDVSEWFANRLNEAYLLRNKHSLHVQEWKSILLFGQDYEEYFTHLQNFYRLEQEIRKDIQALKKEIINDVKLQDLLVLFENEFRHLGKEYRQAIRTYNETEDNPQILANSLTSHSEATKQTIERFVDAMNNWRSFEIERISTKIKQEETAILITYSLLLFFFLLLVFLVIKRWVISPLNQATRLSKSISNGNLNNKVDSIHVIHEFSQLLNALENMQTHIKLSHQSLTIERDRAEKNSQFKSEFLSRMSHELRTPMNAILGFGQILKLDAEGFNKDQQDNVKEILDAGYHLLNLINEVLDLAKIESGKVDIVFEEVHVADLIEQCFTLISSQAKKRKLELIDHVSSKNYSVRADVTRLKQVLLNLLSNAVKYNSEHGNISLNSETVDNHHIRISVTDTGKGLTKDEISRLFSPFERLDAGSDIEGTGIGLVITKHLVELMGGTMGIESEPGEGCTFWFELELFYNT